MPSYLNIRSDLGIHTRRFVSVKMLLGLLVKVYIVLRDFQAHVFCSFIQSYLSGNSENATGFRGIVSRDFRAHVFCSIMQSYLSSNSS